MLEPCDRELVQVVDRAMEEARARSEGWLSCRRGCAHCCIGPFAITTLDGWRLRLGWKELAGRDPERAARVAERAAEARARMGDPHGEAGDDAFCGAHAGVPCPVLDLETGACELYEYRPIACRLHGPAVRVAGVDLRHCRLNYAGASLVQIEQCRVEVDPRGAEDRAVAAFEAQGEVCGRTYIAYVFPGAGGGG